ncbi:helix-turn-helix domain-containing protein [Sphaerisporangium sp. NPDC051011]|uniref:GbsR/MarR family transcriptional regulator n=1 Tax=Sphaerisporangium sp. NPDC051011 TaxID=3155792 RepID=UPI0034069E0E
MRRAEAVPDRPEEFIEQFAERFAGRMPKAASRMLGALMITDEPDLSSKELIDVLGLSPAAVSNSGRLLLQMGLVERTVSPETRRDHYRIRDDLWIRLYSEDIEILNDILNLLDATLDRAQASNGRAITRIRDMRDFYWFINQEMPELLDRYEKWRAERRRKEG